MANMNAIGHVHCNKFPFMKFCLSMLVERGHMTQQPTPITDADATIDHDRLFKTLLTTFFVDFVALFLPEVSARMEPDSLEFLSQEIFTDIHSGEKHIVDVLVKVRLQGEETCLLIHVENQASSQAEFARRMFTLFCPSAREVRLAHLPRRRVLFRCA